ncbi:hypothetical protein R3P38DRAFT_3123422 [Favolaschia claudopus]|uniref:F-box domain-containing protein n=1 Tax=Favolaschia claudopus TaxID=2862362 RepID=A0AAV9ZCD2_9AGAR
MILPNELWMQIIASVKDPATLKAILLTSQLFYALALEEVLRILVWDTTGNTPHKRFLGLLERPEKCRIPRALSVKLDRDNDSYETIDPDSSHRLERRYRKEHETIRGIGQFSNLRSLTLTGGEILPAHFDAFRDLRHLNELHLHFCWIKSLPSLNPNPNSELIPQLELAITQIHLHDVVLSREFVEISSPSELFGRVELLEVISSGAIEDAEVQARALLVHLPCLARLSIDGLTGNSRRASLRRPILAPAQSLCEFSGSLKLALQILPHTPELNVLAVRDMLSMASAVEVMTAIKANTPLVRSLKLTLVTWSDAVWRELPTAVPHCERLNLVYHYGAPTRDILAEKLALPALHTLMLRPAAAESPYRRQYDEYGVYVSAYRAWYAALMAARPLGDAQCWEYLAVLARANPGLRVVGFAAGKAGGEWVMRNINVEAEGDAFKLI